MLARQIRFSFSIAILTGCIAILILMGDWLRTLSFNIGLIQQSFFILFAGVSFLFWDHYFLLKNTSYKQYNFQLFSYLISGFFGFVLLVLARLLPTLSSIHSSDALSNSLTVIGIFLLLLAAYLRFTGLQQYDKLWIVLWSIAIGSFTFLASRGLFTYLLLCVVSILSGQGLLSLLGVPGLYRRSLAPFATMVFWTILFGFFVGLGIPIKYLSLVIWPLTILLAWLGISRKKFDPLPNLWDLFIIGIPLLLLFQYTLYGFFTYPGSPNMDHWAYIAMGQYLWEFSRCAHGSLPPIYRFANDLACTSRYISPSLLSFFSGLLNRIGDSQPSAGIFLPWGMFVYGSSLRFLIENLTVSKPIRVAYILLGALSGWMVMLGMASNFDNLLILPYLPAIFAFSLQTNFSLRWNLMLGMVLASAAYTYPEMLPFVYLLAGIFILKRMVSIKLPLSKVLVVILITGISALILLIPYFSTAVAFLQSQIGTVNPAKPILPGEGFFPELVNHTYQWIALWGMGGGIFDGGFYAFRTAVAILLYALLIYGCYLLIKTREWALFAAMIVFIVPMLFFDFYRHYAYATYKLLVLFWWLIAYVVILAFMHIVALNPHSRKRIYIAGAAGYLAYFIAVVVLATHYSVLPFNSIKPFKQLENLPVPSGKSVAAIITNDYNNIWAAYYLRNKDIFLHPMGGYMVGYVHPPSPDVKMANLADTKYLLTDSRVYNQPGRRIWHNSEYSLYKLPDTWAYVFDIKNPNGLETRNKKLFSWVGNDPAEIKIASNFEGCAQLTFNTALGPSLPNVPTRHLLISTDSETKSLIIPPGEVSFSTYLKKGVGNVVKMQALDQPTVLVQPSGDRRIMLLEVSNLAVNRCR
jgi:hypothetical protein